MATAAALRSDLDGNKSLNTPSLWILTMVMQPISREEVLRVVRMRGPIIPNELKKALKQGDTILLGAMLSELSNKGQVAISKTKLGGSPFYYDPSQPGVLEKIAQHLNEKDRRTHALLREKKVLRDTAHEALTRVSLRNIKDFAIPLTVNAPEGEQLWWKYYLVSDAEAEQLIKRALGMLAEPRVEPAPAPPEPMPQPARWGIEPHLEKEEKREAEPETTATPQPTSSSLAAQQPTRETEKREREKPKPETRRREPRSQKETPPPEQQLLPVGIEDEFYDEVQRFFKKHDITVKDATLIRKRSELDLIILLPTPVGKVEYFCKAKKKARSNDGDLASAKLQGQAKNLPALYLTTGEITKKAKGMLAHEFKGLVVKEL